MLLHTRNPVSLPMSFCARFNELWKLVSPAILSHLSTSLVHAPGVQDIEEACEASAGRLRQVVDAVAVEMHADLASEGGPVRYKSHWQHLIR